MAVIATDIGYFLSAGRPDDDADTSGGAIDLTVRLMDRTNTKELNTGSGDTIDVVSTDAGDIHVITLKGYGTDGTWIEEDVTLTGAAHEQSTNTFLHLCSAIQAEAGDGAVTVAEYNSGVPSEIFVIAIAEKGAQDLFIKAEAEAAGGAEKKLYEKIFCVNEHATGAVISAVAWLSEDEDTELKMDLEMTGDSTTTDGAETTTNRVTEPTTGGTYAFAEHATEGAGHDMGDAEDGNLIADEQQGWWVELTLAAERTPEQVVQWAPKMSASAT